MEALRRLARVKAGVRRAGLEQRIPAESLVPGDVIHLRAGDVVPADARIFEAARLQIDDKPDSLPPAAGRSDRWFMGELHEQHPRQRRRHDRD